MKIRFKKLSPEARTPKRGSEEAAGYDLFAITGAQEIAPGLLKYQTGIAVEIPKGYVGLIFPRSSIYKTSLSLSNSVGVIDSDYRGEVGFFFKEDPHAQAPRYFSGDRIGQLVIIKHEEIEFEETTELSDTKRGQGGFGSTGK